MRTGTLVLAMILMAGSALGGVYITETSVGDSVTVTFHILNTYEGEYAGVILKRRSIGLCEDPVVVTTEPVPLPEPWAGDYLSPTDWPTVTRTYGIPYPNVNFSFTVWMIDTGGQECPVPDHQGSSPGLALTIYVSDGDAPIMRGFITRAIGFCGEHLSWSYSITPCEEGCWGGPDPILLSDCLDSDNMFEPYRGTGAVDLIGKPSNGLDLPYNPYVIDAIIPAPYGACGIVENTTIPLGSVKALFR